MKKKPKAFFSEAEIETRNYFRDEAHFLREFEADKKRRREIKRLKSTMVTRTGLLFSETKSAYEWKKLDKARRCP